MLSQIHSQSLARSRATFLRVQLLATVLFAASALAKDVTYSNPVLPGDHPDPSVVRVGDDYYATATSSEWAPLFPIFHSRDLVNWEQIGCVFEHRPKWSWSSYWAPEISFRKGRFYVYYVGRKQHGPLCVGVATAVNPAGPWTDHGPLVCQRDGSIDAVPIEDENGAPCLVWKEDGNSEQQPTPIWGQKLSDDGTQLIGETKELFRNDARWEGQLVEAPFVLKRNGWFYAFYSGAGCCGSRCSYALGVARSKHLFGPYEKNPANPILVGNDRWKCPGHGSITTAPDGRTFLLYHAYDATDFIYVGRQGLLDEVKWNADDWPVINDGKGPSTMASSPFSKSQQPNEEFLDDFSGSRLGPRWQWPCGLEPKTSLENGELVLQARTDVGDALFGSMAAVQTMNGDYAATTLVDLQDVPSQTKIGLFAYGDDDNFLGLVLTRTNVALIRKQETRAETIGTSDTPATAKVYLRMEATDGHRFRFAVWNGNAWKYLADADLEGNYLPPWDRGVRVALTVGGAPGATAKFDWLRVASATARQQLR